MDARSARNAEAIEDIGTYDTSVTDKSKRITLKQERYDYWLSVGAKPTEKMAILADKLLNNRWGTAKLAPAKIKPKIKVKASPEGEASEAPAETAEA
jgi:small subunit ribosomal protein S16